MTEPLVIRIEQLSLPVGSAGDAMRVTHAMQDSLERLFAADQAAGLAWRRSVDSLTLELGERRGCEEIGTALARALRDRLATGGDRP